MQSPYKVQGQRTTCAAGAQALLLCPWDGTDNLAFQAEKNTPGVTGARDKEWAAQPGDRRPAAPGDTASPRPRPGTKALSVLPKWNMSSPSPERHSSGVVFKMSTQVSQLSASKPLLSLRCSELRVHQIQEKPYKGRKESSSDIIIYVYLVKNFRYAQFNE